MNSKLGEKMETNGFSLNRASTAVVAVDIQKDFTEAYDGVLAIPGTNKAFLKEVNDTCLSLKESGFLIYASQDWHPFDHSSFASQNIGRKIFETQGGTTYWPDHCIQGTDGSALLLSEGIVDVVIRKGQDRDFDSYSAFYDDSQRSTGLSEELKARHIDTLIVFGLATDVCVKATVLDAVNDGFKVCLLTNLCLGVNPEGSKTALEEMNKAGVLFFEDAHSTLLLS